MKRLWFLLALWSVAVAVPAFGQESTEAELNRLEDLRYEALKNADAKLMGELFAEEFVYQNLLGSTYSKAGYIAFVMSGNVKIDSYKRENSRVTFYGDVATVMATTHLDVVLNGEPRQLSLFYLNVWVKRDGRWQLVARQSTALPKK